jgi:hypothetical protein
LKPYSQVSGILLWEVLHCNPSSRFKSDRKLSIDGSKTAEKPMGQSKRERECMDADEVGYDIGELCSMHVKIK